MLDGKIDPPPLKVAIEELQVTVARLYLYRHGYSVGQALQLISTVEDAESLIDSLQASLAPAVAA
jgi:hypothetical protein